jgi:hypothetical protein
MDVRGWWDKLMGRGNKAAETAPSPVAANGAPGPSEPIVEPPEASEPKDETLERERRRGRRAAAQPRAR